MHKKSILKKVIRVDHAGELGAVYICKGQNFIYFLDQKDNKILKDIEKQEKEHLKYFENKMIEHEVDVSIFYPLWKVGAFSLGFVSKFLNKHHECTKAVEEVIEKHYESQLSEYIEDKDLLQTIKKFKDEETEHKNLSNKNCNDQDTIFSKFVKLTVKSAIFLSSKI